jgi:hypothetical protein
MPFFKNDKKSASKKKEGDASSVKEKKFKKKKKVGFRHKNKNDYEKIVVDDQSANKSSPQAAHTIEKNFDNDFFDEISSDDNVERFEKSDNDAVISQKEWSSTKRKAFVKKDMKGLPVFLEDNGEKIGTVFDSIYDKDKNLIGYKIKDNKSDSILSFSLDQFGEDKAGLIFIPSWYTKAVQLIEKLEFKDRISPELTWLLKDKTITEEELYHIFVKHDDSIASYIDESKALRELLLNRLRILEKERLSLKEALMDLTEKRLIKDIDRRKFSEIVMAHRQKVNVLDVNIMKSKQLINRLEETSFGMLSANLAVKQYDVDLKNLNEKQFDNQQHISVSNSNNNQQVKNNDVFENKQYNNFDSSLSTKSIGANSNQNNDNFSQLQQEYYKLKSFVETSLNKKDTPQNNHIHENNFKQIDDEYKQKYINLKNRYENQQKEFQRIKRALDEKAVDNSDEAYHDIKVGYDELKKDYDVLKQALQNDLNDPYEQKYFNLKQEYEDLKVSVEKLLQKNHD